MEPHPSPEFHQAGMRAGASETCQEPLFGPVHFSLSASLGSASTRLRCLEQRAQILFVGSSAAHTPSLKARSIPRTLRTEYPGEICISLAAFQQDLGSWVPLAPFEGFSL